MRNRQYRYHSERERAEIAALAVISILYHVAGGDPLAYRTLIFNANDTNFTNYAKIKIRKTFNSTE